MASWSAARGVKLRELKKTKTLGAIFPEISFEFDQGEIDRLARECAAFPGAVKAALAEATEKTRRATRREFVSGFRSLLTLKPAYIRRGIKSRKAQGDGPAEIRIATSNIPLGRYGINPELPPKLKGVSVSARPRVRYRLRNSGREFDDTPKNKKAGKGNKLFVARMASGHVGAFARVGKKPYGIVQDWAPSLQYHAHADGFLPGIENFSRARFQAAFLDAARKISGVGR